MKQEKSNSMSMIELVKRTDTPRLRRPRFKITAFLAWVAAVMLVVCPAWAAVTVDSVDAPPAELGLAPTNTPVPATWRAAGSAFVWTLDANGNWNVNDTRWDVGTFPNGADAVVDFSQLDITANRTITLGQNITVGNVTIGDTDHSNVYTFTGNTLTFNGTGGATLTSVSDNNTQDNFLSIITLGSDLAVQVNGAGRLNIGTKNAFNLGGYTLSNSGTGTGPFRISSIGTGTDVYFTGNASSRIVQDSATSTLWIDKETGTGAAFLGQTIIRKGRLTYNSQRSDALGTTRPITIGNSAGGSDDAVYQINANSYDYYFDNPIIVAANTTGTQTLRVNNTGNRTVIFRGGVTGNNSLTIDNWGSGGFSFNSKAGTPRSLDVSGTLTHIGTGTGNATINQMIGANVTGVIQNSATSALVLNGDNTYTGPTTVSAGTLRLGGSSCLSDTASLTIASGAVVFLGDGVVETVGMLVLDTAIQLSGTWGSTSSTAEYRDDTYFSGTGVLVVVRGKPRGGVMVIR